VRLSQPELLYWFFSVLSVRNPKLVTPKSGVLLAGSCIAAIASVGSVFELTSGNPELGTVTTGVILAITAPLVLIFFFAAVRDARANQ